MSEHLPECDMEIWMQEQMDDPYAPHWLEPPDDIECQCPKLRACERQMREEHRHRCSGCDWCYSDGVREAIDAARKAVSALPEYQMRDTCISAIDALRRKENDEAG